jgi:hypothetical protein
MAYRCPSAARTLSLVLLLGPPAAAQVPAGAEFTVNEDTTRRKREPGVAMAPDGRFVVTFTDYLVAPYYRFYDAAATPAPGPFALAVDGEVATGGAAYLRNGDALLAWETPWTALGNVAAARIQPPNTTVGPQFAVNTYTTGDQYEGQVLAMPDGGFLVVWTDVGLNGERDVWARRFSLAGPAGPDVRVNTYTTGAQSHATAAALPGGGFVVVWWDTDQEGPPNRTGIFGRRFDGSGAPVGAEFHVNSYLPGNQSYPKVAAAPSGAFVVVWNSQDQDGNFGGVFGQRYDTQGVPAGSEFRVNTQTVGWQRAGGVAADVAGNFIVSFESDNQVTSALILRRYEADGTPRGDELEVVTAGAGDSDLGMDPAGNFVLVWLQSAPGVYSVVGQRFGGLRPAAWTLVESGDNNGVFEAGESAAVRPSWRNDHGQAQAFQGTATFTGPPGATYTVLDGSSDYGTVADGAIASCSDTGDCLAVAVPAPPQRPVVHWDAILHERIVPDAHGQVNEMALHLGDSFSDVPRGGLYYRFVETLLHRGVTSGCAGASYCPTLPATREQMSVFVLAAKEGTGYAPPACTTPVFADVPASSLFCRWIEELARRGVTTGCGGGNYCPTAAVSREQMAVFVLRTLDPNLSPPACTTPVFNDVPASSPFCPWIEELARRGIVAGCGGGSYCPAAPVTREEMAVFLTGTFGLTLYGR